MDELYHSPEDIASFYLQEGARGLPHYKFMCPNRMREVFERLLNVIYNEAKKARIRAIMMEL
ncbi:MAG: hypothetical protein JNM22_02030 [Saprospiraceae bacterium]|nr:hypothetical protein [Saprospiraceae bacterium]